MRFALTLLLLVCHSAAAQHAHYAGGPTPAASEQFRRSPCDKTYTRPPLDPALQKVTWQVTGNETARKYFSQGMTEYYGFNFEAAARNFRAALEADSSMAMAAWGVALASGTNINITMQGECAKQARTLSQKAMELAAVQPGITKLERDLVAALRLRYEGSALENVAYSVALRRAWETAKDDPNVAALYAESMFDLRPWGLFDNAQRPALDTHTIFAVLGDGLHADPHAVGANHLLIHAAEAGPYPGEALKAAGLLDQLVPESGHLVHMPSHIYIRLGDYSAAVRQNSAALKVDLRQYAEPCAGPFEQYWANPDCPAVYFGHYVSHDHFFRSVAAAFAGRSRDAVQSARDTNAHVQRFVVNEPGLQRYLTPPLMMYVAHQRWEDVLREPDPPEDCYRTSEMEKIAPPTPTGWGNNTTAAVLAVPSEVLLARISWAKGERENAIEHLKLAVTHEDALLYDEPPQWFPPARENLGGAYLQTGAFALARDTFEAELKRHPKSGRALYGLMRALRALQEPHAAEVEKQFRDAWKEADYEMAVEKLW